jgi:cytochrome c
MMACENLSCTSLVIKMDDERNPTDIIMVADAKDIVQGKLVYKDNHQICVQQDGNPLNPGPTLTVHFYENKTEISVMEQYL